MSFHDPGENAVVNLWSTAEGEPIATWAPKGDMQAVAVSSNGRWIAVGDESGGIKIIKLETVLM